MTKPRIYTKTGDKGETGLFSGARVSKADPLVNAYGTVDELNSVLGVARSLHTKTDRLAKMLHEVQIELLALGADLGSGEAKAQRTSEEDVTRHEQRIDELEAELKPLTHFILPGGHPVAAQLHQARTVCRRAERAVIRAREDREVDAVAVRYLNRLSDLLFVMARAANQAYGVEDEVWETSR